MSSDAEKAIRMEEALRAINDIQAALPSWVRLDDMIRSNSAIRRIVERALS